MTAVAPTATAANNAPNEALYDFAIQGTGIDQPSIYLPLVYKAYTAASNLEVRRLSIAANNIKVVTKGVATIP